ncbi:sucrose-specific PTS transporter subunit IIBC [Lactobacillus gigeriorum]|uniref:protein-N(pi)-phosphohistidine--sucrose phosphotransferase n=1 Tax=Lactobacillus gigeriorum DSM 23908 = CRBIP 24.85 TaxID=1423751 RepID=I7LGI1_9LACO|nr:sucrose-specific PTS transporter subunit IIBC [Lactobacillus gigeriorum]KRN14241.1 sucrose PTS II ABC [Lactobacillus gigeriorum DSM 23908 = CRBIP 24.85]CCI87648.1 Sucrose PTS II ABC [Lactobacillus gigeriorum DSM 23908 = CRBIP 24.85]
MDHKAVAERVIKYVGRDNIVAGAHCATRLRLVLKDDENIDQKGLDNDPDVKGTFKTQGQYQIIIGPGDVNDVYDEFIKITGLKELSTDDLKKVAAGQQKTNPIMAFIKLLSDIFVPIIPALVAGGLLMALNNFLTQGGLFGPKALVQLYPQIKGLSDMIQLMSAAPFWFLPILVAISAGKRFGANQFLSAAIGMIMVAPGTANIIGATDLSKVATIANYTKFWDIFGLHVTQTSYTYQVIPVLAAVWLLAFLEKRFHKWLPSAVDFTFTPLLSILITGFLTFTIIGPVLKFVSDAITSGIVWLYDTTSFVGMGVFGLFYSAIVTTGLHQSFPAIETQLVSAFANGKGAGDFIFVVASMANVAQAAATFGVWFLTKDQKMKGLASSAGVSAMLGITEPALFGVNLKYRFPFFCALIGSGVASVVAGLTHVIAASMGAAGFIGFLSIYPRTIPFYVMSELISFGVAFALTYIWGKKHMPEEAVATEVVDAHSAVEESQKAEEVAQKQLALQDETVVAPVDGETESLTKVNDQVFSAKMMGNGAAIIPSDGKIYAPVSGEITVAYATKHAYGLKSDHGAEVLIHIGLDTVNLEGKHFTSLVKQGQHVEQGQELGSVDLEAIKQAGYDPTVMVVITNTADYASVDRVTETNGQHGAALIALTAHN